MALPVRYTLAAPGSTPWTLVNIHAQPVNQTVAVIVTGTVNYSIEYTYDDIMGAPNPSSWTFVAPATPTAWQSTVTGATGSNEVTFNDPITAWRVTLNSGSGSLAITGIQAGIRG